MRTILVTGPIGSGKSAVCKYLASLDFPVYECDARTKMLYSLVPGLKCSIEERLGLPWSQIGTVFSDPDKLCTLEEMVYPHVVEDLKAWKAAQKAPLLFIESATPRRRSATPSSPMIPPASITVWTTTAPKKKCT